MQTHVAGGGVDVGLPRRPGPRGGGRGDAGRRDRRGEHGQARRGAGRRGRVRGLLRHVADRAAAACRDHVGGRLDGRGRSCSTSTGRVLARADAPTVGRDEPGRSSSSGSGPTGSAGLSAEAAGGVGGRDVPGRGARHLDWSGRRRPRGSRSPTTSTSWSTGSGAGGRTSGAWSWPRATRCSTGSATGWRPELGREQVRVEPAVSSMQLAFARAGLAWHDAAIASVHGRPLAPTLLPLLGRPKIGLFTQDGRAPRRSPRSSSTEGWTTTTPGSARPGRPTSGSRALAARRPARPVVRPTSIS